MFWKIILGIVGLKLISSIHQGNVREAERTTEEERRKNTPFSFSEDLTEDAFRSIVNKTCKRIKRIIEVRIDGPVVQCKVIAQSGISSWWFTLDYNDFGKLTGKYWVWTDNDDSSIPRNVADRISEDIHEFIETKAYEQETISANVKSSATPNKVIETDDISTISIVREEKGRAVNKWVAFFLCLFFGIFGVHKFYEGRIGMGVLYLFTFGLFGWGWIINTITILFKPNPYYV